MDGLERYSRQILLQTNWSKETKGIWEEAVLSLSVAAHSEVFLQIISLGPESGTCELLTETL